VNAATGLESLLGSFGTVDLEELDQRAALLHRVDVKYVADRDTFAALCERLRRDHEVLEIDRRRLFNYETVYFDTSELRCFHDHEQGRLPRFKARTRLYKDSNRCVFEVKMKVGDDETDKRQIDHPPGDRRTITEDSAAFLADTLRETGIEQPDGLEPSLRTSFRRATIVAATRPDRLTCDVDLQLARHEESARMEPGLVVLESKSENGKGPADKLLEELGAEPISLSKYRTGIELLAEQPDRREGLGAGRCFRASD
jgi:hypothetical protein